MDFSLNVAILSQFYPVAYLGDTVSWCDIVLNSAAGKFVRFVATDWTHNAQAVVAAKALTERMSTFCIT
jgi:hypothetical protein